MKTIDEWLDILKTDAELKSMLTNSRYKAVKFKPRSNGKSESSLFLKRFWGSVEGAQFRLTCERKYALNTGDKQEVSKFKDALLIFISERFGNA